MREETIHPSWFQVLFCNYSFAAEIREEPSGIEVTLEEGNVIVVESIVGFSIQFVQGIVVRHFETPVKEIERSKGPSPLRTGIMQDEPG